jgi:4-hydroxyacetophenone monooxygenase
MIPEGLRIADDKTIREALVFADPMVLMGLLYHATADEELANVKIMAVPMVFSDGNVVADAAQAEWVRSKAFELLKAYRDGRRDPPGDVSEVQLQRAMSLTAGEQVPTEEFSMHRDILDLQPEPRGWGRPPVGGRRDEFNVVVIGAGLAGVNAAVQLKASGIPFTLLEKNRGVGGTWFHNRYPGARVDWPSRLYSHSFGISYPFTHLFAPRQENEAYIRWCVDQYEIESHIVFEAEVTELTWDDERGVWVIHWRGPDGRVTVRAARAVISAIGLLERPSIPNIRGMDQFKGPMFHSSRFDSNLELTGKRVAVVGTGASGMQMVPDLAPLVDHVTVFQRSPGWVLPVPGYRDPLPEKALWLEKNVPYYTNWFRFALGWVLGDHKLFKVFELDPQWTDPRSVNAQNHAARERVLAHLQDKLRDRPDLASKCTPSYPIFGNRPVVDNGWFDALKRDNVELVVEPIERLSENGVVTANGTNYPADIVVFATGFRPNQYFSPMRITGRGGVSVDDLWAKDGPRAYWGVTVPHLPNFFILYGPNANPRNLGPVQYGEWAMYYFLDCMKYMIENDLKSLEVTDEAYQRFNSEMDLRLQNLVSVNPRTRHASYYVNEHGRSAVQSPWSSFEVCQAFANVNFHDYLVTTRDDSRMTLPLKDESRTRTSRA